MLSGIGPEAELARHGIPVAHALPGVGANLQDHLQIRLMYRVAKPITTNDDLRSLWGKARIGLQWLLTRSGPLAVGINQGGLFTRVMPGPGTPDVQFHFATLSADMAGAKPTLGPALHLLGLPTAAGIARQRHASQRRPVRGPGDAGELPRDRDRPTLHRRGHSSSPAASPRPAPCAISSSRR